MLLNLRGLDDRKTGRERRKQSLQAAFSPNREPILSETVQDLPIVLHTLQEISAYNCGTQDAIGLEEPREQSRAYRLGYLVGLLDFHSE